MRHDPPRPTVGKKTPTRASVAEVGAPEPSPSELLDGVGMRATGPRLSILAFFCRLEARHVSAEDVLRELRAQGSRVALGTVYRVLGQLTEVGILTRAVFDAGIAVYELRPEHAHDHLVCIGCGRIEEFVDPIIEERRRAVAQTHGYLPVHRQLTFHGYCPSCRRSSEAGAQGRARTDTLL